MRPLAVATVIAALVCASPAQALLETCMVSANPVAFGNYDPVSATPLDATGQVTVTCTAVVSISVSYVIQISPGSSGSASARTMAGVPGSSLPYNLYTTSARSTIWGDGSGGTGTVSDGYALALLLVARNYPVYARIPARAAVVAGSYTDTLVITVNY